MIIDIVVAAIVLISAIISFLRGLIREVLTIAGVVGGLFAALYFGPKLSPTFRDWLGVVDGEKVEKLWGMIPMTVVADVCAYALVFVVVVIALSILSHFISGAVKALGLGPIDRTLGVVFGIARAVVLLGLIYLPFHTLMDEDSKAKFFADSKTQPYIEKTAEVMAGYIPSADKVKDQVSEKTDSLMKQKLLENDILSNGNEESKKTEPVDEKSPETGYEKGERQDLIDLMKGPGYNE